MNSVLANIADEICFQPGFIYLKRLDRQCDDWLAAALIDLGINWDYL